MVSAESSSVMVYLVGRITPGVLMLSAARSSIYSGIS
jgi:hypothetical protein